MTTSADQNPEPVVSFSLGTSSRSQVPSASPSVSLDPAQDLMKGMTIRTQPRTTTAALSNVALISRAKLSSLSDKDRNCLITDIETGLPQKFTAVDLNRLQSEDAFQLGHTASLAQQINFVFDHLIKYDLGHCLPVFES